MDASQLQPYLDASGKPIIVGTPEERAHLVDQHAQALASGDVGRATQLAANIDQFDTDQQEYKVKKPDGTVLTVRGPKGASSDEIIRQAKTLSDAEDAKQRGGLVSGIDAAAGGITHGALMGFDDEVLAGLNAVAPLDRLGGKDVQSVWDGKSLADAFSHNVDVERRIQKADATAHPVARGLGELGGAVAGTVIGGPALKAAARAVPGATAAAAKVATLAPKLAALLKTTPVASAIGGGVQGAISGAGEGDTLENRIISAKQGGAAGAVLGGALGVVTSGVAPLIARHWNALVGKDVTPQALGQVVEALKRDGYDVTSDAGVKALQTELSRFAGKPVSLADMGAATRARAGVGLRTPSEAQQQGIDTITERAAGAPTRLSADIKATVAPRTDIHALEDALTEQRAEVALPLRRQALYEPNPTAGAPTTGNQVPIVIAGRQLNKNLVHTGQEGALVPIIPDDAALQQLARLPMAQKALNGAKDLDAAERLRLQTLGQDTSHLPEFPEPGQPLSMVTLDVLKRHMDDEVRRAYSGKGSFTAAEATQLKELRDAIRTRMRAVGESGPGKGDGLYGQYLDTYGESSALKEDLMAAHEPAGFARLDPEEIAAAQAKRSDAGKELYRVGVARNLEDVLHKTPEGGNAAKRILRNDVERAQMRATGIKPEDATKLEQSVDMERQLHRLNDEITGSATAARRAAQADADSGAGVITPITPNNPASWYGLLGRKLMGQIDLKRNAKINAATLPRLLAQDPAVIKRTIAELQSAGRKREADMLKRAAKTKLAARVMGTVIGAPVATTEGN